MSSIRLRRAFFDIVTTVLATAAAGCSGGEGSIPGASSSGGTSGGTSSSSGGGGYVSACNPGPTTYLSWLKGVDGAVERRETAFPILTYGTVTNPDDGDDQWKATIGQTTGSLCQRASDSAACLAKVEGFRILPATREACTATFARNDFEGKACSVSYVLYTRGDEIGVARNDEERKVLAGSIDTLEGALWAANSSGYQSSCGSKEIADSTYRAATDGGFDLTMTQWENCGATTYAVTVHVDPAGKVTEVSRTDLGVKPSCAVAGRRPAGFCLSEGEGDDRLGAHFATLCELEAASVVAFRRLYRQLSRLSAPEALLDRVRRAARDEIRHARSTRALSRRFGAEPKSPRIAEVPESASALDVALENAREGCVRETYGALVAHLQLHRATDPEVRAAMSAIAEEETEHAELSWDIAAWLEPMLSAAERAVVANEREAAFRTLISEVGRDVPDEHVRAVAGLPSREEGLAMLRGLEPVLFAA